jgi:hypothetical protein
VLARSGCNIVVLGEANEPEREAEFADDMLSTAGVFVAKRNEQRSAKTTRKHEEEAQNRGDGIDRPSNGRESFQALGSPTCVDAGAKGSDLPHRGGKKGSSNVDRNCAMDV